MKSLIIKAGTLFHLHIGGVDHKNRITVGIKSFQRFNEESNYVAVVLDKTNTQKLIDDLQARMKEFVG